MGSGTTGVAAKKFDRQFIGVECNHEYFCIARDRTESYTVRAQE
jgi:DNA modification methylase